LKNGAPSGNTFFFHSTTDSSGVAFVAYGLDRFSEDLDFSLLKINTEFSFDSYLDGIRKEFEAVGMHVSVKEKDKTNKTNIESAFLKSETVWQELTLERIIPQNGLDQKANIKIKLGVDTRPPLGFGTEEKLLLNPFSFYVKCFTISDLFAGKMHALLFRKWQNNVKGRDWYDLEWYIRRGIPLDMDHFIIRARDSGDWHKSTMTEKELRHMLKAKIDTVNFARIKADISRFIPDQLALEIWSPRYFRDVVSQLKILHR
jgi:Nucleotidyl transferase AbiEii toxin, Type IV TA system